ncbi:proton channel OtopLc-like isoform X14 [Anthonomus grandis grandis]|uniref:proton channel OtopLc-like isoform X14 n=1 Tax=Anthonomus grandis grandis TaxID=2921223 RepID=UPI00216686A7|nr:proton channel OtopLc-like isoform X14 [Anthonomus grandis grandis]
MSMLKHKVQDRQCDERLQNLEVVKCRVKIYKTNMQRCPYIHEMKERLLGEQPPVEQIQPAKKPVTPPSSKMDQQQLLLPQQQPVGTVVKLNPDGYGSHTSPTHLRPDRTPLMPKQPEDDFHVYHTKAYPKNAKTSLFIIMSFVYAKLLVVVCIAYVFSDVVTHNIPLYYYEGFFTYLYGMSILFLLYVFCFLLQESSCCAGNEKEIKVKQPPKQKAKEKEKERKQEEEKKKKEEKEQKKKEEKEKKKEKDKKSKKQDKGPQPPEGAGAPPPPAPPPSAPAAHVNNVDVEGGAAVVPERNPAQQPKVKCKRKTTQNDHSHGSFFLRIGAIAFGLGTMIYNGLEFGVFFEIPFNSPCYMILRGVNPVLQMIFTFMQMYFIFMNSRLNIHRFKVVARFGLMHVVATNLCVWIRTLVLEYIKEITIYHRDLLNGTSVSPTNTAPFAESIKQHTLRNANTILGTHLAKPDVLPSTTTTSTTTTTTATSLLAATIAATPYNVKKFVTTTARSVYPYFNNIITTTTTLPTTTTRKVFTTAKTIPTTMYRTIQTTAAPFINHPTTTAPTRAPTTFAPPTMSTLRTTAAHSWQVFTTQRPLTPTTPRSLSSSTYATFKDFFDLRSFNNIVANEIANVVDEPEVVDNFAANSSEMLEDIQPEALINYNYFMRNISYENDSCGRINIMGTIVQDSAPYLFPFIIEYSLIGAAVIYCMWKHIGRNPRYVTQEDLEHRLEIMLSRRAVAMAQAQQGRVDCVGASKGLFFGLLMLVASLICLILFFVLIHHKELGLLAIYLADVSHCVLMVLSIVAIIIGFIRMRAVKTTHVNCRVQGLKFRTEEQSDLNDILLRVSAFGLFTYAVFSVIAGHFKAFSVEPNMLVMVTGILSVVQVVLQLLFIADVSRRRVHLPEHDRTKPGRQVVTFLLICNITMWIIYTFETQKVEANPVQKRFYGFLTWAIVQRVTLPLCIFHRFHSAVTLAEIWKTSYKARLE